MVKSCNHCLLLSPFCLSPYLTPSLDWIRSDNTSFPPFDLGSVLCESLYALSGSGQFGAAEARLRHVERMLGLAEAPSTIPTVEIEDKALADRAGEVATVRAAIANVRADTESVIAFAHRALTLLAEDNLIFRTVAAMNLSDAYLDSGDLVAASRANSEAISVSRAAGFHTWMANSLNLLGRVQMMQGHLSEAAGIYEQVLRLAAEHGDVGILGAEGEAHILLGELLL